MNKPYYKFMCNCMRIGCELKAEYMISDPNIDANNPPFNIKKPLLYLCEKHMIEDKKDRDELEFLSGLKITNLRMIELGLEDGW